MKLSYTKTREVLGILIKSEEVKEAFETIRSGGGEMSPLEFVELVFDAKVDVEILEVLVDKNPEDVGALEAVEAFIGFFSLISESWQILKPLLTNSKSASLQSPKSTV